MSVRGLADERAVREAAVVIAGLLLATLAGALVARYSAVWITVFIAPLLLLFVVARPLGGLILIMAFLYFPLLPSIALGPWEGSVTAFPLAALGIHTLMQTKRPATGQLLAGWQWALLAGLGVAFLLSTAASVSYSQSVRLLPNLLLYLLTLFATMTIVNSPQKLVTIAKAELILAAFLSIWRVELRPLRLVFDLPSLGINGAVFGFHPAIALSLVILLLPGTLFSRRWRWFAGLTLFSLVTHGLQYQTRAGWLAWMVVALVLFARLRGRRWLSFGALIVAFGAVSSVLYADIVAENWANTRFAIQAFVGENPDLATQSGDDLRVQRFEAGKGMFLERPVLGWGPNQYHSQVILRKVVGDRNVGAGAFNSWLIYLVDFGIVGTALAMAAFVLPLLILWRALGAQRSNEAVFLAFGFALGALALTVHLFFIDLPYSFAWFHAGLALAAARIGMDALLQQNRTPQTT